MIMLERVKHHPKKGSKIIGNLCDMNMFFFQWIVERGKIQTTNQYLADGDMQKLDRDRTAEKKNRTHHNLGNN